jgi:hypothetical protein
MIQSKLFLDEEHKLFNWAGGQPAALVLHGFPSRQAELRPLGTSLHRAGWMVPGLLLPGLGPEIETLLWTGIGFLLGAMPFSYWLGHLFRQNMTNCGPTWILPCTGKC